MTRDGTPMAIRAIPPIHMKEHQNLRDCLLVALGGAWAAVVGILLIVILAGLGAGVSVR
jgi:hypothetical protein